MLALAVEGDGTPHVVYAGAAPEHGLHHAVKRGGLWTFETLHADLTASSSLALEADGTPHVVFVDADSVLWHARRDAAGVWTSERIDPEAYIATPSVALDA